MQEVLEFILKNITTIPDDVVVTASDDNGVTNYSITVNPDDVGRIIGKEGKIIKAIRTIMRVMAIQQNLRVRVSVVSDNDKPATDSSNSDMPEIKEDVVVTVEETPEVIPAPEPESQEIQQEESQPEEESLSVEV